MSLYILVLHQVYNKSDVPPQQLLQQLIKPCNELQQSIIDEVMEHWRNSCILSAFIKRILYCKMYCNTAYWQSVQLGQCRTDDFMTIPVIPITMRRGTGSGSSAPTGYWQVACQPLQAMSVCQTSVCGRPCGAPSRAADGGAKRSTVVVDE